MWKIFSKKLSEIIWKESIMALLPILKHPDPRLHIVAKPIEKVDDRIRQIAADMAETMYESRGIGLAATQVDIHERLVTIDLSEEKNQLLVLVNPEIVAKEGQTTYEEGCLSIPGIYETVCRAEKVSIQYQDLDGKNQTLDADGLLAICIQHEIDHLDGKLFVEYLSTLKQGRIKTKLSKLKKQGAFD